MKITESPTPSPRVGADPHLGCGLSRRAAHPMGSVTSLDMCQGRVKKIAEISRVVVGAGLDVEQHGVGDGQHPTKTHVWLDVAAGDPSSVGACTRPRVGPGEHDGQPGMPLPAVVMSSSPVTAAVINACLYSVSRAMEPPSVRMRSATCRRWLASLTATASAP